LSIVLCLKTSLECLNLFKLFFSWS
jgi:hypothetical protein